ncbi:hypothetical protein EDC30_10766 [Paucimonas lemoignei]|uniref:PA2779 family protein n=2 Tax=Paucimonas lemoignei TaxID=29443 RepID=A0A4R3HXS6_PAULE|nr:hypothetical protein EDC30_10766 [Paucimonas lemoignei]
MAKFRRFIASLVIVCLTAAGFPLHAFAAIVSTHEAMAATGMTAERERVTSFFSRDDVRKSLEEHGVEPQAALDRISALTDDEVQQLAARIDQAPAGGEIIGVLFAVFVILLVTDILGLTKVFPFTRSIR